MMQAATEMHGRQPILDCKDVSFFYGDTKALTTVSMTVAPRTVTALIGPSGCGKSTLLRCFNRMNDFIDGVSLEGSIRFDGLDVYSRAIDPTIVRRRIGMVFQKPNPFSTSIRKNILWGPKINGYRGDFEALVERSLRQAALWDEVKDKLGESGLSLSGGQQQRLCIARALAMSPDVILMDEPCSALDPASTEKIEQLIHQLKRDYTIVIVTHNMQQARRVSDMVAFMYTGELIEFGSTEEIFETPKHELTRRYVQGHFG